MALPFRIGPSSSAAPPAPTQDSFANYMDRLIRLIPGEVLGVYLTGRSIFAGGGQTAADAGKGAPSGEAPPGDQAGAVGNGAAGGGAEAPSSPATPSGDAFADAFLDWWPAVCLILLIAFRIWGTRADDRSVRSVEWATVLVSLGSFVVWIYAMGDDFFGWRLPDGRLAAIAVVVWVFVIPMFYKGSQPPTGT